MLGWRVGLVNRGEEGGWMEKEHGVLECKRAKQF
jgi:hypothetical protein